MNHFVKIKSGYARIQYLNIRLESIGSYYYYKMRNYYDGVRPW